MDKDWHEAQRVGIGFSGTHEEDQEQQSRGDRRRNPRSRRQGRETRRYSQPPDGDSFPNESGGFFSDLSFNDPGSFTFKARDISDFFSSCEIREFLLGSQHLIAKPSSISAMNSQSSMCDIIVSSPISANKPKDRNNQARVATCGYWHEASNDEDIELEAGSCEQSTDPNDPKRIRRYFDVLYELC